MNAELGGGAAQQIPYLPGLGAVLCLSVHLTQDAS